MRSKIRNLVIRWRMEWAIVTVILYLLAIPFTFWIFPDNNLWLALLVLFSGFTASLTTLADLLIGDESEH